MEFSTQRARARHTPTITRPKPANSIITTRKKRTFMNRIARFTFSKTTSNFHFCEKLLTYFSSLLFGTHRPERQPSSTMSDYQTTEECVQVVTELFLSHTARSSSYNKEFNSGRTNERKKAKRKTPEKNSFDRARGRTTTSKRRWKERRKKNPNWKGQNHTQIS